jgi:RNA polymerase sigma-70 factor (ECF subfamily)
MWRRRADNPGEPRVEGKDLLDEELIARRAAQNPADFAPLYRHYLPEMLAFCLRRLGNQPDAEDATAEIFRKALAGLHTFKGGSFRKWLYTVAVNTLRDVANKNAPPAELFDAFPDPNPGPEEQALLAASRHEVARALDQLPEEWQIVVELRSQGFRCGEVAAALGRDAGWVRLTHHRAVERLARELGVVRQRRTRHG